MMITMEIGIVGLLRLAWFAGILPILIACLPFTGFNFIHHILLVSAGRGKIIQSSSRFSIYFVVNRGVYRRQQNSLFGCVHLTPPYPVICWSHWGTRKLTVPQKFFSHFYVLAVLWTSLLLLTTWAYAHKLGSLVFESTSYSGITGFLIGGSNFFSIENPLATSPEHNYKVWRSVLLLLLMEIQVIWRLYESIYVFNYSSTARMHVFGYLTGLFFYTAAPLSLCCDVAPEVFTYAENLLAEFIVKGKSHMPPSDFQLMEYLSPLVKLDWWQWAGAAIFFWGWLHQRRCHGILGNLREVKEQADDYQIPHGDWFEMVSSPHYFAEMVIYAGLLVASGGLDLTVWLLFAFVVTNLTFAAMETHRWYHRKFDNYPCNRYAVIPFLY